MLVTADGKWRQWYSTWTLLRSSNSFHLLSSFWTLAARQLLFRQVYLYCNVPWTYHRSTIFNTAVVIVHNILVEVEEELVMGLLSKKEHALAMSFTVQIIWKISSHKVSMTAENQAKFSEPSFKLGPVKAFKPYYNYKLFNLINCGLGVPLAWGYVGYS